MDFEKTEEKETAPKVAAEPRQEKSSPFTEILELTLYTFKDSSVAPATISVPPIQ